MTSAGVNSDAVTARGVLGYAAIAAVVLGTALAVPMTRDPLLVVTAIACVLRARWTVFALMIASVLVFLNPAIAPAMGSGVAKWLVVLAASVRAGIDLPFTSRRARVIVLAVAIHGTVAALLALAVSQNVGLSLFKVVAFGVGACSIVVIAGARGRTWTGAVEALSGLAIAVCALSLPLLAMPEGYAVNGVGFQGILNHPQGLGVFLAPPIALWGGMIISGGRTPWLLLISLAVAASFTYLSEARTALIASGIGIAASALFAALHREHRVGALRGAVLFTVLALVAGLSLAAAEISPAAALDKFVSKRREGLSLVAQYVASRGKTYEPSIENFRRHPVAGIGFGIGHDVEEQRRNTSTVMGIPIGASTEKGNVFTAVLEETGVLGMLSFALLLAVMARAVWSTGGVAATALLLTIVAANLGEMTFFSLGGWGLYQWVLLGAAIARSDA